MPVYHPLSLVAPVRTAMLKKLETVAKNHSIAPRQISTHAAVNAYDFEVRLVVGQVHAALPAGTQAAEDARRQRIDAARKAVEDAVDEALGETEGVAFHLHNRVRVERLENDELRPLAVRFLNVIHPTEEGEPVTDTKLEKTVLAAQQGARQIIDKALTKIRRTQGEGAKKQAYRSARKLLKEKEKALTPMVHELLKTKAMLRKLGLNEKPTVVDVSLTSVLRERVRDEHAELAKALRLIRRPLYDQP